MTETIQEKMPNFDVVAKDLYEPVTSLLREYGAMYVPTLAVLLKIVYGVHIDEDALTTVLWRLFRVEKQVTKNGRAEFCLVGDRERESFLPRENTYLEPYLRLRLRWEAVRKNPTLLDLTDEMIDRLYLPGRS